MKTATVRDIRTRFPEVEGWLAESGAVGITKAGRMVAKLVPADPADPADNEPARLDFMRRYAASKDGKSGEADISGILIRARE